MDTNHPLHALNIQLVELESAGDAAALGPLLHDALVFRRASGSIASKAEYLASLEAIRDVRRHHSEVLDFGPHGEDLAVVVCRVEIDRDQEGPDGAIVTVQGAFLNVRVWTRVNGDWLLIGWFNQRA